MSSILESDFDAGQKAIKAVSKVSTEDQLLIYAHYKQATVGPATGKKPSGWGAAAYKFDAWSKLGQMDVVLAQTEYCKLVDRLSPGWRSQVFGAPATVRPTLLEAVTSPKCASEKVDNLAKMVELAPSISGPYPVLQKASTAPLVEGKKSWKEKAGRSSGREGYQIGDWKRSNSLQHLQKDLQSQSFQSAIQHEDSPGSYIIKIPVILGQEKHINSEDIKWLSVGSAVHVVEVVHDEKHRRIRGRVEELGWISVLDLDQGTRWAVRQSGANLEQFVTLTASETCKDVPVQIGAPKSVVLQRVGLPKLSGGQCFSLLMVTFCGRKALRSRSSTSGMMWLAAAFAPMELAVRGNARGGLSKVGSTALFVLLAGNIGLGAILRLLGGAVLGAGFATSLLLGPLLAVISRALR